MPKLTLPDNYIYAGKHYGPGEVDIEDEAAYTAIKGKIDTANVIADRAAAEQAEREHIAMEEAVQEVAAVRLAEQETQAANRAAEKKR